jgi:hypothetical protein
MRPEAFEGPGALRMDQRNGRQSISRFITHKVKMAFSMEATVTPRPDYLHGPCEITFCRTVL